MGLDWRGRKKFHRTRLRYHGGLATGFAKLPRAMRLLMIEGKRSVHMEGFMVYEMRFQTVDPAKRAQYVKTYREAVQGCKQAGSIGGHILCSEDDPSAVIVILLWESKEHLARWRGTESYKSFRAAVEPLQTKKSHGGFFIEDVI